MLYAAILAHYVADGHVPLHAVVNYDGQLTGQQGLHSRWEAELFERNRATLKIAPPPVAAGDQPARLHVRRRCWPATATPPNVLESDQKAAAGREFYDDAYFEAFAKGTLPVLEQRAERFDHAPWRR